MTKEEYEEMRNTIDSVGEYFNSIEELTKVRDLVKKSMHQTTWLY